MTGGSGLPEGVGDGLSSAGVLDFSVNVSYGTMYLERKLLYP